MFSTLGLAYPSEFGILERGRWGSDVYALGCVCVLLVVLSLQSPVEPEDNPAKCSDSKPAEVNSWQAKHHISAGQSVH